MTTLARASAISAALEPLGWSCTCAELDMHRGIARVVLKRDDGRVVTLHADSIGRASVTREQWRTEAVAVGRRGDRARVERLTPTFLGRDRYDGIRSAMRGLANYVADNVGADRRLARAPLAALLNDATKETDR